MGCSSCSRPLPDGARFCPFCGHEIALTAVEERRVVTVLFADIVGFTALSEHLDPERVKRLVDGAFSRLIEQIERFGGVVDKLLGDGVLALFGAPRAHEDDPDRAVRAALAMHRELAVHMAAQPGIDRPVDLRIGINTGEVVVGRVRGSDDYTAMGDVVNVAARLQSMAPPGGTYVGGSTAAQLSDAIERRLVADLEVRGRDQTEQVWQVIRRTTRLPMPSHFHRTPFVGRRSQRELLRSVMELVAGGRGAIVAVTGEAGAGKTRLVDEAIADFPGIPVVFAIVCAPYGEGNVWTPIADSLFRLMRLERSADAARLRSEVEAKSCELYGFDPGDPRLTRFVEATMHLFGHPSEFDRVEPAVARETLFQVVIEALHRRSHTAPVVLWVDDLQWADVLLLDLLERVARVIVDRPVLVVTAQRDDVDVAWPPSLDQPVVVRIPLDPLGRAESDELVELVVGDRFSADLADQLYDRSGGNPLFLTQLATLARDEPDAEHLPASLRALIAARLDGLTASQRVIVDNASVLGVHGVVTSLELFAREMGQSFEREDLDSLVEEGLLVVDDETWAFRSDVVREVAYQTLTKAARAQRHAGTAAVMEELRSAPIDQIAHHAASAAEIVADLGPIAGVRPDIGPHAIALLAKAARRALELGAFNQAIKTATRGLDLVGLDDEQRRILLLMRANAAIERREVDQPKIDVAEALESAVLAGNSLHEAIARRLAGSLARLDGDLPTARRQLDHSIELLRDGEDQAQLVSSLSDRGFVEIFGGSLPVADEWLEEAEVLARDLGDDRRLAWVRQHRAWVAFLSGDHELAERRLHAASALFEQLGDRAGASWADGLLAYVRFFERRFDEAEQLAHSVRAEAGEVGERWAPAMMDSLVASIRMWDGRISEAEELSRRALASFRELGDRFGISQVLIARMRALVALGRTAEAERAMEEALSLAEGFADLAIPTMAAAGAASHLGRGERAVSLAEHGLERFRSMGADDSEGRVTYALGLCQIGEAERALAELDGLRNERPYSHAVRAVAAAMSGLFDLARREATRVGDDPSATYLDRTVAAIASVAVALHAAAGGAEATDLALDTATTTFDAAWRAAVVAGDVVAQGALSYAGWRLLGEVADLPAALPSERLGEGWRVIVDRLADVAGVPRP